MPALKRDGQVVLGNCLIANHFFSRFLGLMGRRGMPSIDALVFPACNSIHTFFMRFSIDVVLCDSRGEIVEIVTAMAPWRLLLPRKHVTHIIEMKAGRCAELEIVTGNRLECEGAWK
jgi:uncharacterized protein